MAVADQTVAYGKDGVEAGVHKRGNEVAVMDDADGAPWRIVQGDAAFDDEKDDGDALAAGAFDGVDGVAGVVGGADDGIGAVENGVMAIDCDACDAVDDVADVVCDAVADAS